MKKLIIMFALLLGVVSMKAQSNDLYQGITKKLQIGRASCRERV